MAYKDKDRQREANRQAQARFKAKGITNQGITDKGITEGLEFIAKAAGEAERAKPELTAQGNIRVSNPGVTVTPESVRPVTVKPVRPKAQPVRPEGLSDNQWAYIRMRAEK